MSDEYLPNIKLWVTSIALQTTPSGAVSIREVENLLNAWMDKGYVLQNSFKGEAVVGDHVNVVWVFVKKDVA